MTHANGENGCLFHLSALLRRSRLLIDWEDRLVRSVSLDASFRKRLQIQENFPSRRNSSFSIDRTDLKTELELSLTTKWQRLRKLPNMGLDLVLETSQLARVPSDIIIPFRLMV